LEDSKEYSINSDLLIPSLHENSESWISTKVLKYISICVYYL